MQSDQPGFGQPPDPYHSANTPVHDFRNPQTAQPSGHVPQPAHGYPTAVATGTGVRYAPFLTRFFAWLIDGLIVGVGVGVVAILGAMFTGVGAAIGTDVAAIGGLLMVLVLIPLAIMIPVAYHVMLDSSPAQGTLGKQWLGIRVVTLQGQTVSKGRALARVAVRFLLSGAFVGLGYFLALFTERKQALHDLIAETVVLER